MRDKLIKTWVTDDVKAKITEYARIEQIYISDVIRRALNEFFTRNGDKS